MKTFSLVALAALASTALADVSVFTDTQCMANKDTVSTAPGNCYNVASSKESALGCASGYTLRVYTGSGCSGSYANKPSQQCVNLGGQNILSVKCLSSS